MRSLGYRTDLMVLRATAEVLRREGYTVVRSPAEPTYYGGNLIVFDDPPGPGDDERWPALFAREFADMPDAVHRNFGWDDPDGTHGHARAFVERGYELELTSVLAATEVHAPPRPLHELEVRPLASDEDWRAAFDNQMAARPEHFDAVSYGEFKSRRVAAYRALAEAGRGCGYGAFLDGRLVADLGIYHDGQVARYQSVVTHPDFRRRGVCGTLVHRAGRLAMESSGARRLVMCAASNEPAEGIYRSVGFERVEAQSGLCWWPR